MRTKVVHPSPCPILKRSSGPGRADLGPSYSGLLGYHSLRQELLRTTLWVGDLGGYDLTSEMRAASGPGSLRLSLGAGSHPWFSLPSFSALRLAGCLV